MLVGWNSRVEASRAVREALDLLSGAEEVRLALVDPEASCIGNGRSREPASLPISLGTVFGWRSTGCRTPVNPWPLVLGQHAIDTSADMIIMGAFGRRRLREGIFGGVTRWIVDKPPLPLFLAL
ncbi:hypothetical protein [Mesorhizobium sp. M1348]|uniref:universal stress protein n=1 Tax=Mesorhizobium sp. M1348 TaxID=2957089 RepID=UPI003339648B